MANEIIDELIKERVDIFRSAFTVRAKTLFHDGEKQNKLRHTGENPHAYPLSAIRIACAAWQSRCPSIGSNQ